ncbi:hypothetical protein DY000_02012480 [Brassica cretica]|uniref:Uncharacterized protein n=1 Tax=Brassica cretica TaxID=69181 RepID=A0ABQ7D8V8_BRACR|nr:hypothetical protein DY000_02012480 [Brassica cretica]
MMKNQNSDDSTDDFEYDFEDDGNEIDAHKAMPNWLQINPITIRKEILKLHKTQKIKAKKFLKDFQGRLTLSYEWMISASARDFTCLTAHFIDDNFNVRSWILGFTTGASIPLDDIYVNHFRKAVQDLEVEDKVSTILLPNRAGFDEKNVDAISVREFSLGYLGSKPGDEGAGGKEGVWVVGESGGGDGRVGDVGEEVVSVGE